ncbi:Translation factor GUF1-like protein, mitochondrial [Aphelenchoides bicaudatus]|nr:Translation factor GUF1-like protein, mitochondrial [Aphelenchoides bicaudatus]
MCFLRSSSRLIQRRCLSSVKQPKPQVSTKFIDLDKFPPDKIRSFSVIAHVDHGKSTLSDRLLEITNVISKSEKAQFLDNLQVEKERGITVKAQTCSMFYKGYLLNLIDTPGHVDFNFEVARSLRACNGVLLLVAANSGVQAQTIANFDLCFNQDLTILPVINKIDLPGAKVELVKDQLKALFDFNPNEIRCISAKSGLGVEELLDVVINEIPPPNANPDKPFRAIVFDASFVQFTGAIPLILVADGSIEVGQKIKSYNEQKEYEVAEIGILHPDQKPVKKLYAGQVGYVICNMKTTKEAQIGETLYCPSIGRDDVTAFAKFTPNKPSVYAGVFPFQPSDYELLKKALERFALTDFSFTIEPDSSAILGLGWRVGFLGMLHLDVFAQRLEQEYDANVILTAPSVEFKCKIKDNETIRKKRYAGKGELLFKSPEMFPEQVTDVEAFFEPMVMLTLITPTACSSEINALCDENRGERIESNLIDEDRMLMKFRLPLGEVVTGFFDELKRISSGFASFDYQHDGFRQTSLVKLCILINDKLVNELSLICPESVMMKKAKMLVHRLKKVIPQQQYTVKIKATAGERSTKALCQVDIKALRKDVLESNKGTILSRDRLVKKLSDQKKGKERLRSVGNVKIPREAFIAVLTDTKLKSSE